MKSIPGYISVHLSSKYFFCGKTSCKCQSFTLRFGTWRKALQHFQEHENSMAHKEIEQSAIYKDKLSEVDKAGTYSGGS